MKIKTVLKNQSRSIFMAQKEPIQILLVSFVKAIPIMVKNVIAAPENTQIDPKKCKMKNILYIGIPLYLITFHVNRIRFFI